MKREHLNTGNLGEKIAKKYLQDKGFRVLEQNCKNKYGEIDLVCKDKDRIVFVEVKTRVGEQFGRPEDALTRKKRQHLIRNAQAYMTFKTGELSSSGHSSSGHRIDAVCIVLDENKHPVRIDHYENITS